MTLAITETIFFEDTCKRIQQDLHSMRFIGVINHLGHLVAGGFREGILSHMNSDREYMMYMGFVLEMNMRKDFDDALGKINYIHSQREKVNMISIPIGNYVILLATEIDVDVNKIVRRVKKEFIDWKSTDRNLKHILFV